jgi:3-phosphoshikimate 1-carboxyvinyltransferase
MMRAIIERSKIYGRIRAPRSKSHAIRLIFSSLLSSVEIIDLLYSDDVLASIDAMKSLGVRFDGRRLELIGRPLIRGENIYVRGSATTLRMLIPVLLVIGGKAHIDGDMSLRRRPLDAIVDAVRDRGVYISGSRLPVTIEGRLDDMWVRIRGSESSQYISGFMIAFCLAGNGKIYIEPPIVSRSYIYLTKEVIEDFGCRVSIGENVIVVDRIDKVRLVRRRVEGDYALSSFYAVSALTSGGRVEIYDLYPPKQYFGDHSIFHIYRSMGAESIYSEGSWVVTASDEYRAIDIDIENAPDLGVSIAPLASISRGVTRIRGIERLRIKESDRASAIIEILGRFGGVARYSGDVMEIEGIDANMLRRADVECNRDHRVAMMASSIAVRAGGSIDGAECVNKSNPDFWKDLSAIGGRIRLEG